MNWLTETDVGKHSCYIWPSRCHAISDYTSNMMCNPVFIFVYILHMYYDVTVVTHDAKGREYLYGQQLSSDILTRWNTIKNKIKVWFNNIQLLLIILIHNVDLSKWDFIETLNKIYTVVPRFWLSTKSAVLKEVQGCFDILSQAFNTCSLLFVWYIPLM